MNLESPQRVFKNADLSKIGRLKIERSFSDKDITITLEQIDLIIVFIIQRLNFLRVSSCSLVRTASDKLMLINFFIFYFLTHVCFQLSQKGNKKVGRKYIFWRKYHLNCEGSLPVTWLLFRGFGKNCLQWICPCVFSC